jgi:TetR/AcrR family transcriptional repressor of nem operon
MMSDMATTLMDLAEKHLRVGGYAGFSYRDLADAVGIKNASIHYHFPTKENLVARVLQRYTAQVSVFIDELAESEPDPVKLMTRAFGMPVHSKDKLCPCVVLGAAILDLPAEVKDATVAYYDMWLDKIEALGLPRSKANVIMSQLVGAQLLANVQNDTRLYDDTAAEVEKENAAAA